jgi:hypothetical protein
MPPTVLTTRRPAGGKARKVAAHRSRREHVAGRVCAGERPWRDELGRWARAHRDLLLAHPDAVPQLVNRPNPGLGATRIGELAFAILARAGFDAPAAVNAFAALLSLNYGWASFAAARRLGAATEVGEQVTALPADAFPHTAAVAAEFADYDAPERYDWALARLLDGLESTTTRRGTGRT